MQVPGFSLKSSAVRAGVCLVLAVLGTVPVSAQTRRHAPPAEPRVRPQIARQYQGDADGNRIEDALTERATRSRTNALARGVVAPVEMIPVELVFTEQVTQAQLDEFERMGGEITYVYQTLSYGWVGKFPLAKVNDLPAQMGGSLVLLEEAKTMQMTMFNATQSGRVRPVWASGFAGSASGYDGSTNITVGIIDTGVDQTHTDLANRKVYWKDWIQSTNTTAVDYNSHGTHVAGIALGTGAAGGQSGAFSFTTTGDLTGKTAGNVNFTPIALTNVTTSWKATATWLGGSNSTLYTVYVPHGTISANGILSASGASPVTVTDNFLTPATNRSYMSALTAVANSGVKDYVVTNYLSTYYTSGDGFNRMRGVAPGCNWAGARVFNDDGSGDSSLAASALDDMVTYRTNYNIKVINMSLATTTSGGINTSFRQKVNTAVNNGVLVVASVGNNGTQSTAAGRAVADPGRAAYALTVGAVSGVNTLTAYSSEGSDSAGSTSGQEEDYKPDLVAPGGSDYYGHIVAPDSNNNDGTDFSDQKANDYTPLKGTSMAAPFAAGAAALVIDALQDSGQTWSFTTNTHPLLVKMYLCATATELNANRENNSNNPTLERAAVSTGSTTFPAGKDRYEGYGLLNPDAAIEALAQSLAYNSSAGSTFGSSASDRRAWARKISLEAYRPVNFALTVPAGADYDLYVYDSIPGTYGKPTLLASATTASTNTSESLSYMPTNAVNAFVVVKRVSGSGAFSLGVTSSNNAFASAFDLPILQQITAGIGSNLYFRASGSLTGNNANFTTESGEVSLGTGASGKTAWYKWVSPLSGTMAVAVSGSFGVKLYTGSSVNALTAVTAVNSGLTASNVFTVAAGTTYRLAVDGTNSASGSYTLAWSPVSLTNVTVTNFSAIVLSNINTSAMLPYPASIIISGVTQSVSKVTVSLNQFTAENPRRWEIMVAAPNNKGVKLMDLVGGVYGDPGVAFTNKTILFDDSATNSMTFGETITNTYYTASVGSTSELTTSMLSPAPSQPYSTNLSTLVSTPSGAWSLYCYNQFTAYAAYISNGWTLNMTFTQAQPPVLAINSTALGYTENQTATVISSTATVTDTDNTNFNGGNLTVSFTANGASEDGLTLLHEGTGAGQLGVVGNVVSYQGTNFGSYTGGSSGAALVVNLTNTSAAIAAVQQLIKRVAYTNSSDNPSTSARTVQFALNDGSATGSASKTINITSANDAPTLTSISTLTGATEDAAYNVLYTALAAAANEADVDSANVSFRVESVANGTLTSNGVAVVAGTSFLGSGGTWVWTPSANTNGTLTAFTVKAYDGAAASATALNVNVTVTAVNDAPTLTIISALTNAAEDTAYSITYSTLTNAANEADTDGDTLSFRVAFVSSGTLTKNGTAVTTNSTLLNTGDTLVWTPATNAFGTNLNAFTVSAWDGTVTSSVPVQVQVAVSNVNDAPTLTSITALTNGVEDTAYSVSYAMLTNAANEADLETNTLSFRVAFVSTGTLTKNGAAVTTNSTLLSAGENLVWTPATNVFGTNLNAFTVSAWDGATTSAVPVQVTVAVAASNDAPVLTISTNPLVYAEGDVAAAITTNAVITDVDNMQFSGGSLLVAFNPNMDGADRLTLLTEGSGAGQIGLTGTNVTYGGTSIGTYSNGLSAILVNFTNTAATPAAVQKLVTRMGFTNITDNPAPGTRSVKYTLADGSGGSASATNTINFSQVNDAPTISSISTLSGAVEDTAFSISNVTLTAASDIFDAENNYYGLRVVSVLSGTLTFNGVAVTPGSTTFWPPDKVVWTPATNASGSNLSAFTLQAFDGALTSTNTVTVRVNVSAVNDTPTLTAVSTLGNAWQETPFTVTYAALTNAADEADVDGDFLSFRVEGITSGTLTKNGTNVVAGSTLVTTNDSLVWTPATNVSGAAIAAFTVRAWDGVLASATAVAVSVKVQATTNTLFLSRVDSTNGYVAVTQIPTGGNLVTFRPDTLDAAQGQTFQPSNSTPGIVGWQITDFTLMSQTDQTISSNAVWKLTVAEWQPSTNGNDMKFWTNGTDADSLAGFTAPTIILRGSGSLPTNTAFNGGNFLKFTFDPNQTFFLRTNRAYVCYFTVSGTTNNFVVRANFGNNFLDGMLVQNAIGTASSSLPIFDLCYLLGGSAVSNFNSAPTLTTATGGPATLEDTAVTISYTNLTAWLDEADADNDALSFRIESVDNGTLTKNGTNVVAGSTLVGTNENLVWTPSTNAAGSTGAFTVRAWDGQLASSVSVTLTGIITNVNDLPTLSAAGGGPATLEDTPVTISYTNLTAWLSMADVDSGVLSFRIESVSTGTLTKNGTNVVAGSTLVGTNESVVWTPPTNAVGSDAAFTVRAWDGLAASSASVTLTGTVTGVNDAPILVTGITNLSGHYGEAFSYTFPVNTFVDVDGGQTLTYTAIALPPGLSLTNVTRTIGGTVRQIGTFNVRLIATDNGSPALSTTNTFSFTITPGTLIVTAADATRAQGQTNPVFTGTITGLTNSDNITAEFFSDADADSPPGTYAITFNLEDPFERLDNYLIITNEGTLTVTNGNVAPSVTLTAPVNGTNVLAGYVHLLTASATDSDGTVSRVAFYEDNTLIATVTNAPFQTAWTNGYAGVFSLKAIATDNAGGTNASAAVAVTANPNYRDPHWVTSPVPGLAVNFYGKKNETYVFAASTNLVNWTTLQLIYVTNSPVQVMDTNAVNFPARFYRSRVN